MEQKLQRYGPLGAILGIILVFVSFAVHGRWASTEESAQEIADLYVQNQDRVFMGSWVAILGGLCMLVFGMCMSQRVRDTGQQLLGMLVAGATLIAVAGLAVDSTLRAGFARLAGPRHSLTSGFGGGDSVPQPETIASRGVC